MTMVRTILDLLRDHGPMTWREIAEEIGNGEIKYLGGVMQRYRGKLVHICGYRRDNDGGRMYPRAIYKYGPGVDAKRPPPLTRAEYNKRFRSKIKQKYASVWQLAVPARNRAKKGSQCSSSE